MTANRPIIIEKVRASDTSATGRFRVGRRTNEVRFDGVAPDARSAREAFAAIAKIMGMETNRSVVSLPRLSSTFTESMAALERTHLAIYPHHHQAPLHTLHRREAPLDAANDDRRVAAFFSGGVDSLDLVIEHGDIIDDLLFVRGFDVQVHDLERNEEVLLPVREAAASVGKPLIVAETDLRDFSDPATDWTWFVYAGLIATTLMLSRTHKLVLCAASVADQHLPVEAVRNRSGGFGNERTELRIEGRTATRVAKLEKVAAAGVARSSLRVCWQNVAGTINCGLCDKCIRTMVGLAAVGMLDQIDTLPDHLDLESVAASPAAKRSDRAFLQESLESAEANGHAELASALRTALAAGNPS